MVVTILLIFEFSSNTKKMQKWHFRVACMGAIVVYNRRIMISFRTDFRIFG